MKIRIPKNPKRRRKKNGRNRSRRILKRSGKEAERKRERKPKRIALDILVKIERPRWIDALSHGK